MNWHAAKSPCAKSIPTKYGERPMAEPAVWIVNASPTILLARIGCVAWLENLADTLWVPDQVIEEVSAVRVGPKDALNNEETRIVREPHRPPKRPRPAAFSTFRPPRACGPAAGRRWALPEKISALPDLVGVCAPKAPVAANFL
jgi:hypothetical protein